MLTRLILAPLLILVLAVASCSYARQDSDSRPTSRPSEKTTDPTVQAIQNKWQELKKNDAGKIELSDEEWQKRLTPEQYRVCRRAGTEPRYTGTYWDSKKEGTYHCVACGTPLFASATKFDSGTGWPSYWEPAKDGKVGKSTDHDLGYARTEVHCGTCASHLGHVFDDAPETPTGLRYCINSVALQFIEAEKPVDAPKTTEKPASRPASEEKQDAEKR